MAKLRKTLGAVDSPYIAALMRAIETQSKPTLINWSVGYAERHLVPIYEKSYPNDPRPRDAIAAAHAWLRGEIKLPAARQSILSAHAAAREAEEAPAAQAAARAVGQAASSIHMPSHSLGLAFYGAAAIAYDRAGTGQTPAVYDAIAAEECEKMLKALRAVSVAGEPNPAKLKWNY